MSLRQLIVRRIQGSWRQKYLPSATLPAHDVDCPECGLRNALPKLRQGQQADCGRCGHQLVHVETEPYATVLACSCGALILMLLVYSLSFADVLMLGVYVPMTLVEMVGSLLAEDRGFLGLVMFALTFGTPVLFLLLAVYVYSGLYQSRELPLLRPLGRLMLRLRDWIMVDVFFVSMLVAYIKIRSVAEISFGPAFWLMPLLIVLILRTVVAMPVHWVYAQIRQIRKIPALQAAADTVCCTRCLHYQPAASDECAVCGSELFARRPGSLKVSFMFLLAAMILYLPANLLPIMVSENPRTEEISTILSGIIYMWRDGDRFIAAVIFSASIAVPSLKIVSMLVLLAAAKWQPPYPVRHLSLQYRITEAVGRWSMIDIFVIIIMMTTFHTPLARVTPGPAAVYFCLVVILTMLSAYFFDPRLLWDQHRPAAPAADAPDAHPSAASHP